MRHDTRCKTKHKRCVISQRNQEPARIAGTRLFGLILRERGNMPTDGRDVLSVRISLLSLHSCRNTLKKMKESKLGCQGR